MVKEWKKKEVEKLKSLIKKYPVVGILDMHKMPTPQLQQIKKDLKGRAEIIMSKKRLMTFALEKSEQKKLIERLKGQPAFILTEMNPFKLFKYLENNKTPAPAKAGDKAPGNSVVSQGSTGIAPGPAIGQLSGVGVMTKVQGGKIFIIKDVTVAKEGNEINPELANVFNLLSMEPMEVGLNLSAVYENGIVFDKSVLKIDEAEFMNKLNSAITGAINLSLNCSYLTKTTAPLAIQKAFREAKSLALEAGVYTKETMEDLIAKLHLRAQCLKAKIPE